MHQIGLVMAGGLGKRMKSDKPKVLHEVQGVPLVNRALNALRDGGATKMIGVLSHKAEEVQGVLAGDVQVIVQEQPRGTASAVVAASHLFAETDLLAVSFGDMPWINPHSVQNMYNALRAGADAAVLTYEYVDPPQFGRVVRDENGDFNNLVQFKDLSKKQLQICEADAGLFAFRVPLLLEALKTIDDKNAAGELYLTDVPAAIVRLGGKVRCVRARGIEETLGVNDKNHLDFANRVDAIRIAEKHLFLADESQWVSSEARFNDTGS